MDKQEIIELAMWTARAIYDAMKEDGKKLSAVDENLIANFVKRMLEEWQSGAVIDTKRMLELVDELEKPKNYTLSPEMLRVFTVFVEKFPQFVAESSDPIKV